MKTSVESCWEPAKPLQPPPFGIPGTKCEISKKNDSKEEIREKKNHRQIVVEILVLIFLDIFFRKKSAEFVFWNFKNKSLMTARDMWKRYFWKISGGVSWEIFEGIPIVFFF